MYKFLIFSDGMVFQHFKADKIKTSYACEGSPTTQSSPPPIAREAQPRCHSEERAPSVSGATISEESPCHPR